MTPEIITKLTSLIQPGLVAGIGTPTPGGMCIEAAVSLATTGEFGDAPPCVAAPDRAYAVKINDATWSSPHARAAALLPLAIAQIGTAGTDRTEWCHRLAEGTIRRVVPMALRAAASAHPNATHRAALEAVADRCETEGTSTSAYAATASAYAAYAAYTSDASASAASTARDARDARAAYAYATDAAASATDAAAYAAYAASATDASAFAAAAAAAAASAAYASARAASAATVASADASADAVLRLSVQVALDAYAATSEEP